MSSEQIECPVCMEKKISFVNLECQHKICLSCYHNCMYFNHYKCSLCRNHISELADACELIKDIELDVKSLEKKVDELEAEKEELEEILEQVECQKEDLQDKYDEMWAQLN